MGRSKRSPKRQTLTSASDPLDALGAKLHSRLAREEGAECELTIDEMTLLAGGERELVERVIAQGVLPVRERDGEQVIVLKRRHRTPNRED